MMAGLLLLLSSKALRVPLSGWFLAFLLSVVQGAWVGWFVGLLTFVTSLKARFQLRLLIAMSS